MKTLSKHIIQRVLITVATFLLLFLTLPYPFVVSKINCSSTSIAQNCETAEHTSWAWFGGYHIVPERLLPKSSGAEREMTASRYYGVTYAGAVAYALISLLLSLLLVAGGNYLAKPKQVNKHD